MRYVFLAALVFLAPSVAAAQIVNVQPLVAKDAGEGFSGVLEGAIDWRTGTTDLLLLSGKVVARYAHTCNRVFLMGNVELGSSRDVEIIDRSLVHLRYQRGIADRVAAETFAQHDRDQFRRLALRALFGAGPRFDVVRSNQVELALGTAYMLEIERYSQGMFVDAGAEERAHRLSTYIVFRFDLDDRVKVGQTAYVQPRFDEPSDVKVLSESELLVTLTKRLSLKTTFRLAYDSAPPESIVELDTALKTGLQLTF